jgi:hypothetical protein
METTLSLMHQVFLAINFMTCHPVQNAFGNSKNETICEIELVEKAEKVKLNNRWTKKVGSN